jgi:hypothetical protein
MPPAKKPRKTEPKTEPKTDEAAKTPPVEEGPAKVADIRRAALARRRRGR